MTNQPSEMAGKPSELARRLAELIYARPFRCVCGRAMCEGTHEHGEMIRLTAVAFDRELAKSVRIEAETLAQVIEAMDEIAQTPREDFVAFGAHCLLRMQNTARAALTALRAAREGK